MSDIDFGKLFNKLCIQSNKTNSEIARGLGVDKATIGRWRTGERSPKLSSLSEIADFFNVDIHIFSKNKTDVNESVVIQDRLSKAMKNKGITQADLARITNLGRPAISQYLSGKITPKPDKIYILAEALNVSPTWLMGWDVSSKPIPTAAEIKKSFSDNLSFYMKKHNLTNKDIAGITGAREKKVEQWLTGESNPRLPALQNMAEYFGVTVHELISGTPIKSADDVIKNMLLSKEVSEKIGYDPNSLDDERIEDITEALVSFLKLTVK